jgi:type I restriction enzyme S subunit
MAGFIPKRIDSGYLKHLLRFIEPEWSVYEQGSTFTAVNKSTVADFEVSVPSTIDEQGQIAQVLDSVEEYLLTLSILLEKLKWLKQGLMNDLIMGKVRLL